MQGVTKEGLQRIAQFNTSKGVTIDVIESEFKSLLDELDDLPEDGKEEAKAYMREMLEEFGEDVGAEDFEGEDF